MAYQFTTQINALKNITSGKVFKCSGGLILLLTLCCSFLSKKCIAQVGSWVPVTTVAPHFNEGVMLLLTDGSVLCKTSSGGTGYGTKWDRLTPDIHGSYVNGTWTTIAPMLDERLYFSSQVLRDGRVYVAGGEYGSGGDKSEVYDPLTNSWTACPQIVHSLTYKISDANSEILPDGKVLQAVVDTGGTRLNYIWDPTTNTYTPTASCIRGDNEASWVKLPDNSILFVDNYSTSAERYWPPTNTWINEGGAGTVPVSLYDAYGSEAGGAFLLPNGKAFFIGSRPTSAYYTPTGTITPGTWAAGPVIPNSLGAPDAASAMMVNGKILMALSPQPYAANHFPDSTFFWEFDYTTNTYTNVSAPGVANDTLLQSCYLTNMLCLPDGNILFANQYDNQYYEYVPGTGPIPAGKPTINRIIENSCTNFTITGTLFNGITEGASYGDDWQMSTNYPIVRLTSGTNVYYARTTNWNSTGVMRGALPDTATFTLSGVPNGTYSVQVIANGNPSDPFSLTTGPAVIIPSSTTICEGAVTTLSSSISGGTWSSGSSSIAAIGSLSGLVTGNTAGNTTIVYALGTCTSLSTLTVNATPAAITPSGAINICSGSTATLSDATSGGIWSSSATGIATVAGGVVTGAGIGTATISYTLAGCSATSAVTINPLPGAITGVKSVCTGLTTALSDAGGGTWTSSNTSVATVDIIAGIVTGGSLGTSTITYTLPTGCTAFTTVTVNLSASPITGTTNICQSATTNLTDALTGGTWSSSNTSVATIGTGSGFVNGAAAGTSTITYKLGSGCATTTIVTVNTIPVAITGSPNLCVGTTTTLSDAVTGGAWSSGNTAVATIDPSGLVTGISASTATITYTLGICPTTTVVTVNITPSAITGASTVCTGQTTGLSDVTPGGVWGSSNTLIATVASGIVTGVSAGSATISYSLITGCETNFPITVVQSPAAITGNPSLCIGLNTTLTDASGGGAWTSSNTSIATVGGTGIVTGIAAGTTTISYTNISGCAVTDMVTVNSLPSPISGFTIFCSGATTSLSDAVTGGVWSSSNTAVATAGSSTGIISGITIGSATITYTLGAGCETNITVSVISGPSAITGITTTCPGFTTTLSDATPGGTWGSSNTTIASVSAMGVVMGVSSGTATISYSLSSGCTVTALVTIGATTAAPISGPSSVCIAQTNTLSDASAGGVWSSSSTARATVGSSTGIVTGVSAGVVTITYKVTNPCGTATTTKTITINSLPVVSAISGTLNLCFTGTTTLTDATPSGVWSSSNTAIATVDMSGLVSGVVPGAANISYTVTNISGCSASAVAAVSVNAPIIATITPASSTSFCTGGFVMLNATAGAGYTYQWQVGGSDISGATSSGYLVNYSGNFTVVIKGATICASTSVPVTVTVNPSSIVVPAVSIAASPGAILCLVSSPVTFTPTPTNGGLTPVYQWYVNGAVAVTGPTFTYSPANGDLVKCVLTSNAACAFPDTGVSSLTMTISAAQTPSVSITASPGDTVCNGKYTTFIPVPVYGGAGPIYSWTKNSVIVGSGPTYSYIPSNGDLIGCTMVSNFVCLATTTAVSSPFKIYVKTPSVNTVTIQVTQSSVGTGQVDTFVAIAPNGGTSPAYQWYVNGIAVPGEISATYITSTLADGDIVKCSVTSSDECAVPNVGVSTGIKIKVGRTGIQHTFNTSGSFTLEPNPNTGAFTITGALNNLTDEKVNISITNMLGQTIYKTTALAHNGDFNEHITLEGSLANGMYLVSITSGEDHIVFHVVVNR